MHDSLVVVVVVVVVGGCGCFRCCGYDDHCMIRCGFGSCMVVLFVFRLKLSKSTYKLLESTYKLQQVHLQAA